MAKQALRDLQSRLAERMQAARSQEAARSWLAVESGGQGYLLPLNEAGEIFPASALQRVPFTQPWFMGVANLRGGLFGVVNLAAFLGRAQPEAVLGGREGLRDDARLVAFNASLEINCALWVDRLAGLRALDRLKPLSPDDATAEAAYVGDLFEDEAGRRWRELRLSTLANEPTFLGIAEGS
jgi:twitching motility protein PilI